MIVWTLIAYIFVGGNIIHLDKEFQDSETCGEYAQTVAAKVDNDKGFVIEMSCQRMINI